MHVWLKLAGMTAERWQRREARRLYSPRPDGPNHNANKEPTSHLADALAGSRHRPCDKRHNKHREGTGREKEKLKSALENGTEAEINWGRPLTGRLQLKEIMPLQPATESRQSGANQRLIIGGGTPKIA